MQVELTPQNIFLFGILAGAVFGLIPLILGIFRKKLKFGLLALLASIVGGAILGIYLAIPVSAVCAYLILRKPVEAQPVEVKIVNENPINISVKDSENS